MNADFLNCPVPKSISHLAVGETVTVLSDTYDKDYCSRVLRVVRANSDTLSPSSGSLLAQAGQRRLFHVQTLGGTSKMKLVSHG